MVAAKNVCTGLLNLRQIFFGLFDMTIHTQAESNTAELWKTLRREVTLIEGTEGMLYPSTSLTLHTPLNPFPIHLFLFLQPSILSSCHSLPFFFSLVKPLSLSPFFCKKVLILLQASGIWSVGMTPNITDIYGARYFRRTCSLASRRRASCLLTWGSYTATSFSHEEGR